MTMQKNIEKQKNAAEEVEVEKPILIEKGEFGELAKTAFAAVLIALVIRALLFEPFNIPSSSMKPTLLVGDFLFVNKPAYGYSRFSFPFGGAPIEGRIWAKAPQRGDVVVFKRPTDTKIDFIKRVIGLPGETIQVRRGRLYINGDLVEREFVGQKTISEEGSMGQKVMKEYIETLPGGAIHRIYEESDHEYLDNTEVYTVPEGHYFMMGDNRDNSQDSRVSSVVGPVPFENFVGRADFLFFSTNSYASMFEIWKWPWTIRYERLLMDIDPVRPPQNKTTVKADAGAEAEK